MRKLSKRQKNILKDFTSYYSFDQLPEVTQCQVERANDYESLHTDVGIFLSDNYYTNRDKQNA
jgi:heme oxygenase